MAVYPVAVRVLWIVLAGGAGALSRYALGEVVMRGRDTAFPLGTLVVNLSGSFLVGFLFTLFTGRFLFSPGVRTAVLVGFLGAYTTYSTFSFETVRLLEDGAIGLGLANVALSVLGGVAAVWLGIVAGRAL